MLTVQKPQPVKFICGFLYQQEAVYTQAKFLLKKRFGALDFESDPIAFNFTDYYQKEMGANLWRRFISFEKLKQSSGFVSIKLYCIKLERRFACGANRRINIDPGYLTSAKLVLTTTKDFSHRIHMGKGIFAEVTLQFSDGAFRDMATTFPDYRTAAYKNIFHRIRQNYQKNIRHERKG